MSSLPKSSASTRKADENTTTSPPRNRPGYDLRPTGLYAGNSLPFQLSSATRTVVENWEMDELLAILEETKSREGEQTGLAACNDFKHDMEEVLDKYHGAEFKAERAYKEEYFDHYLDNILWKWKDRMERRTLRKGRKRRRLVHVRYLGYVRHLEKGLPGEDAGTEQRPLLAHSVFC
jgi:hypothetical protein